MCCLQRSTPSSVGVDPAALIKVINILDNCNCHSALFVRHDKVFGEGFWHPYNKNYNHVLFSLSKSFVSVAICFAVQENLLSFDDYLTKYFPEYFPSRPCENMEKVQIKHLLSMTYGHNSSNDLDFYTKNNWLEENLHLYIEEIPGTKFYYDNRCPFLLSVILQKVTNLTLFDFLKPRLFVPLGIPLFGDDIWWEMTKDGKYNIGRGGLNLKTEEIAIFGQFLLRKGNWKGKQLLKEEYVDLMTTVHITNNDSNFTTKNVPDWKQGYGYYFWMCQIEGAYRADGACCQFCVVMPKQDIVVAITAGSTTHGQVILQALWDNLTENLDSSELKGEEVELNQKKLEEKFSDLLIEPASFKTLFDLSQQQKTTDDTYIKNKFNEQKIANNTSELKPSLNKVLDHEIMKYSNKVFLISANKMKISKFSVVFSDDFDIIRFWINNYNEMEQIEMEAGHGKWIENDIKFHPEEFHAHTTFFFCNVACSAAFLSTDSKVEYELKLCYTRTPYIDTLKVAFDDKGIVGEYIFRPIMIHRGDIIHFFGREE